MSAILTEALAALASRLTSSGDYEAVDVIDTALARIARLEEALREIEGGSMMGMVPLVLAHDWHAVVNLFQARARAALGSDAG